jgi:hypothetical protein
MKRSIGLLLVLILPVFLLLPGFLAAQKSTPAVFTVQGNKIVSPSGEAINLCGWRVDFGAWSKPENVALTDFQSWDAKGLLGNAQGVEFWYSRERAASNKQSPSEYMPHLPGVYNEAGVANLLTAMRNIARSGSWIIPSVRVSYDQEFSLANTKKGINTWQGWANHRKVIYNLPVVVEEGPNAGTYGNHRDRFFAWLDWILPKILADEEIASKIAYWEMWHYYGHKHNSSAADKDQYLDDFIPKLIAKYREHDPHRLLGVGITLDGTVNHLISRCEAGTYTPYDDHNWMYVCGGYGILGVIMRPNYASVKIWPKDSNNPTYLTSSQELNIEKLIRLSGRALHSQEGPGLRECYRDTPIPQMQRNWLTGLYNLYNQKTNGYGFHAWPPSWANQQNSDPAYGPGPDFDETDFFNLTREALKGNQVSAIYTSTVNLKNTDPMKIYSFQAVLRVEGLEAGQNMEIYTITGNLFRRIVSESDHIELSLPKGIFLVKAGGFSKKVIIN